MVLKQDLNTSNTSFNVRTDGKLYKFSLLDEEQQEISD